MPRKHRLHKVNIYADILAKLEAEAALHGISSTEAFNQATQLWVAIAQAGFIGKQMICSEAANRRSAKLNFLIPGNSPEVILDKTIDRLQEG